jgi:uncharacterized membrane protein YphA (DoxX/SURF4 family)
LSLRKLYSTFPGGWFGLGLLLLRVATAVTLILQGAAYVTELRTLQLGTWVVCLITLGSGVSLLAGFVTPIASVLAVVVEVGVTFLWLPAAGWNFFHGNPLSLDVIVMALASAFLGPGAFSLDAHLFGRRRIIIPRCSLSPKS